MIEAAGLSPHGLQPRAHGVVRDRLLALIALHLEPQHVRPLVDELPQVLKLRYPQLLVRRFRIAGLTTETPNEPIA